MHCARLTLGHERTGADVMTYHATSHRTNSQISAIAPANSTSGTIHAAGRQPDKTFRFIDHSSSRGGVESRHADEVAITSSGGGCMAAGASALGLSLIVQTPTAGVAPGPRETFIATTTASSSSAAVSPADHRLVAARGCRPASSRGEAGRQGVHFVTAYSGMSCVPAYRSTGSPQVSSRTALALRATKTVRNSTSLTGTCRSASCAARYGAQPQRPRCSILSANTWATKTSASVAAGYAVRQSHRSRFSGCSLDRRKASAWFATSAADRCGWGTSNPSCTLQRSPDISTKNSTG